MRIIAGKYRGRNLAQFGGKDIRPTSDRVKESVFQILSLRIPNARVLDLFCGSGALGIECLSRGAAEVVFNDISADSLSVLKKNLSAIKEKADVFRLDYKTCLNSMSGKFDLIFADPPYKENIAAEILTLVKERSLLNEGGLVVFESEREEEGAEGFERIDLRGYGRTKVAFFERKES